MNTGDSNKIMYYCDFYEKNTCCSKYFVALDYRDVFVTSGLICQSKLNFGACAACSPDQNSFVTYVTGVDNIQPGLEFYQLNLCSSWCDQLYTDCSDAVYLDLTTARQVTVANRFNSGDDLCSTIFDRRNYNLKVNVQQSACWSSATELVAVLALLLV